MKAYILITVAPGTEKKIKEELKELPQIKEVDIVYGTYDLIAIAEVEGIGELHELVLDTIRQKKEVERTVTLVVAG